MCAGLCAWRSEARLPLALLGPVRSQPLLFSRVSPWAARPQPPPALPPAARLLAAGPAETAAAEARAQALASVGRAQPQEADTAALLRCAAETVGCAPVASIGRAEAVASVERAEPREAETEAWTQPRVAEALARLCSRARRTQQPQPEVATPAPARLCSV